MRKNKIFKVDTQSFKAMAIGENDVFYNRDTDAHLTFTVSDTDFDFDKALLYLVNLDDGSMITGIETEILGQANVEYEITPEIMAHYGRWKGQIVFQKDGEKASSAIFEFRIERFLTDERPPTLNEIVSLEKLRKDARELIEVLEQMTYDPESLTDVLLAKDGELTLDARIKRDVNNLENKKADKAEVSAQLAQKATKEELSLVKSLTPKQPFSTLAELQSAHPDGDDYIHVVTEDGHWYYWDDVSWVSGGVYQATQDDDVSLLKNELAFYYDKRIFSNGVRNSDFADGTEHYIKHTSSTFEIKDGKLRITKAEASNNLTLSIETTLPYVSGHKYYIGAEFEALTTPNLFSVLVYPSVTFSNPITIYSKSMLATGQTNKVSHFLALNSGNGDEKLYLRFKADYTAGSPDAYEISKVMVLDLTNIYGAGNEPTDEDFLNYLNSELGGYIANSDIIYDNKNSKIRTIEEKISTLENGGVVSRFTGKNIACFGDSITMKNGEELAYSDVMKERIPGANIYNVGFGGCRMSLHTNVSYDAFSMYRLADAMVSGDWSLQEAHVSIVPAFAERLNTLKSINFNALDYMLISYGTNDYYGDRRLETDGQPLTHGSYIGSARYSVDKILSAYPHIKIILLTPIWREVGETYANGFGLHLYDFVDGLIEFGKEQKLPVVDMYYDLGINDYTYTLYLSDGLHANDTGKMAMGNKIASYFESNF